METIENQIKPIVPEGLIGGNWRFTYKLTNHLGQAGFSGYMLAPYVDPATGRVRRLFDMNGMELAGYFFDFTHKVFDTRDPWQRRIVDWLIGHPEVGIEYKQTKVAKGFYEKKISNPRIKLVNLDYQDIEELQEEDFIDKLVGRIVQDNGVHALGIDKLRFILAKMNFPYRDEKYINEPKVEKQKLRQRLKSYVRTSYKNAQQVEKVMDDLEGARRAFEIKEMIRLNIITVSNTGMYQYEGNPIGVSFEAIQSYFDNNPEFYAELLQKVYEEEK